jgi:hypothetical protein
MDTAEGILYRLFSPFLLILLCFFCVSGDVAWCQGSGPRPYWSEPGYKVSAVFGPSRIVLFVDRNRVRCLELPRSRFQTQKT